MHNALKVPITVINEAHIESCVTCWTGEWKYKPQYATWRGLTEETKVFKYILQRIIFPARFEDATPAECKIICACGMKGPREQILKLSSMGLSLTRLQFLLPLMNNSRSVFDCTTEQPYYSPFSFEQQQE